MSSEYELMIVVPGDFSESDRSRLIEEVKKVIESEKGEILQLKDWGKRELAFAVKKQSAGYYTLFNFKANSVAPAALDKKINLMEELLRFLVVKKEEGKEKSNKATGE